MEDLGRSALEGPVRPEHDLVGRVLVVAMLDAPHGRGRRVRSLRLGVVGVVPVGVAPIEPSTWPVLEMKAMASFSRSETEKLSVSL